MSYAASATAASFRPAQAQPFGRHLQISGLDTTFRAASHIAVSRAVVPESAAPQARASAGLDATASAPTVDARRGATR